MTVLKRMLTMVSLMIALVMGFAFHSTANASLIASGDSWMYQNDGTLPAANWYTPAYSDVAWSNGVAPLGYGSGAGTPVTILSYGGDPNNRWMTYYFRKHFNIPSVGAITGLLAQYEFDDGAVVYLNGSVIYTSRNITNPVDNTSGCITNAANPVTFQPFTISPSMLVNGDNVLAVEVHQGNPASSDVYLDMMLDAVAYVTTNEVGGAYAAPVPPDNWTAYNDCAWTDINTAGGFGQTNVDQAATDFSTNSPAIQLSGPLVDSTGEVLAATVTFDTNSAVGVGFLARSFAFPAGTPLDTIFGGMVGTNSAVNWAGGTVNMTLSGLNTTKQYSVAIWSSRGSTTEAYSNRFTDITISSVDSFANNSTAGNAKYTMSMANDSVEVRATIDGGRIAKYDLVRPGADGTIVFSLTAGADGTWPASSPFSTNGYINAFMVQESDAAGGVYVDADNDGMDDNWEVANFGSTSATNGGMNQDADGDGSSNYDEYHAGTNPNDANSTLEFTSVKTNVAGTVVLSWDGVTGKVYSVQQSTNLATAWSVLQSGIVGVTPTTVYTNAVSTTRRYLRVKVQ